MRRELADSRADAAERDRSEQDRVADTGWAEQVQRSGGESWGRETLGEKQEQRRKKYGGGG